MRERKKRKNVKLDEEKSADKLKVQIRQVGKQL